ncbi:hypothetical protein [Paracoccus methylarcula]|uniref:LPS export ABC transporter periplasmic protein LptC n=1 Tax=Paracoccus methylarcula TaxID=72022 RepID=A0A422R1A9_9RHOB|nr:hypothetical protein [Paracoccus methylarcula]RNF36035.1 hypothetical protein A7A09_001085 [Paracoccus methylarcula]
MSRTRIVRWLRVLLPLLALAILSTMFLFSSRPGTDPEIPYAEVDAERMAREPRMVAPEYSGVTDDGAELSLRAAEARPRQGEGGTASQLRLDWRRQDGLTAQLTAPSGGVEDGGITLQGGVRLTTSTGWTMEAARIDAATDRSRLFAPEGVDAAAPFGEITAGGMELRAGPDKDGAAVLDFTDGVRLIYQP